MIIQKTKLVEFFSDFNGFRVVMKNLNYDFIKNLNNRESTIKTEIKKFLSNISQGSLTKQLRELEEDGIVGRKVYPEVPPRVEYFLTEIGKRLTPILDSMEEFGNFYIDEYLKNH